MWFRRKVHKTLKMAIWYWGGGNGAHGRCTSNCKVLRIRSVAPKSKGKMGRAKAATSDCSSFL